MRNCNIPFKRYDNREKCKENVLQGFQSVVDQLSQRSRAAEQYLSHWSAQIPFSSPLECRLYIVQWKVGYTLYTGMKVIHCTVECRSYIVHWNVGHTLYTANTIHVSVLVYTFSEECDVSLTMVVTVSYTTVTPCHPP